MAKQIAIVYEDKQYTLEFTRAAVQAIERQGFKISEVQDMPVTMIPMFFAGAFQAHHSSVKRTKIDEIYTHLKGKDKLIECLIDMYSETITSLMAEPEGDSKNAEWTMLD